MLFLHALLFFILGTFAVAAPIDSNTSKPSVEEVKKRLVGYWISDVSDNLSHLVWSLIT